MSRRPGNGEGLEGSARRREPSRARPREAGPDGAVGELLALLVEKMATSSPRLGLSPAEAAACLGISRDLFDRDVLPGLRVATIGRRIVVPVKSLEAWLDRNAAVPLR
jgi:hypothetical protein